MSVTDANVVLGLITQEYLMLNLTLEGVEIATTDAERLRANRAGDAAMVRHRTLVRRRNHLPDRSL